MKINTKVVFEWNDESKQYEEVYSESYDYDGEIAESQEYGAGLSLLYRDMGIEEAEERKLYEEQLKEHEEAVLKASEESSALSLLGSTLFAAAGFYGGGFKGAAKGWTLGGEAGKWAHRGYGKLTGTAYDPADYALGTDMGKFGVSKKYDIEDINRQFEEASTSQFWKDVTGTGTAFATMAMLGGDGGAGTEEGTKSFWDMTGKEMIDKWKA